jgi:hypothetical protein
MINRTEPGLLTTINNYVAWRAGQGGAELIKKKGQNLLAFS